MRQGVAEFDVTIQAGHTQVLLPNGFTYDAGQTARLTEWQVSKIGDRAYSEGLVTVAPVFPTVIGGRDYALNAITLDSVAVTPATPSIAAAATQQFTATATYSDGTTVDVTSDDDLTWTSDDEAVATIDTDGLATGVAAGTATITASYQRSHDDAATEGTATLTVT